MSYIEFLKEEHDKIQKGGSYLFTGDEESVKAYNANCTVKDEKVITELLPQPICGDIRNAKIIICSLNPGWGLETEEKKDNIIFNSNTQNPTLSVEKSFGAKIFEHIKALTNSFTKIL